MKEWIYDMKNSVRSILFVLVIVLIVWAVTELFGIGTNDPNAPVHQPTAEDYKRWQQDYEQYGEIGHDVDLSIQYGGR